MFVSAAVRDWVLVPLTLSVVLMMVLRQYITKVGFLTGAGGMLGLVPAVQSADAPIPAQPMVASRLRHMSTLLSAADGQQPGAGD